MNETNTAGGFRKCIPRSSRRKEAQSSASEESEPPYVGCYEFGIRPTGSSEQIFLLALPGKEPYDCPNIKAQSDNESVPLWM